MAPSSPFLIEAREVHRLLLSSGLPLQDFLASLVRPTQLLARPPISSFFVGAVGLGSSGCVFRGVNLEFPGLPLHSSVHAEQFLIANAAQNGECQLRVIAVSAAPCGHCRQFLQELRGATELRVLIADTDAEIQSLSHFLPHRFGPNDVLQGDFPLLLDPRDNGLSLLPVDEDKVSCCQTGGGCSWNDMVVIDKEMDNGPSLIDKSVESRYEIDRCISASDRELSGSDGSKRIIGDACQLEGGRLQDKCSRIIDSEVSFSSSTDHPHSDTSDTSKGQLDDPLFQRDLNKNSPPSVTSSLRLAALEAANKSHAPYSNCPSGMALLTSNGNIYSGSYMESVAHNPSLPPLQAALIAFVSRGGGRYSEIVQAILVEMETAVVQFSATTKLALEKICPDCIFHVCYAFKK